MRKRAAPAKSLGWSPTLTKPNTKYRLVAFLFSNGSTKLMWSDTFFWIWKTPEEFLAYCERLHVEKAFSFSINFPGKSGLVKAVHSLQELGYNHIVDLIEKKQKESQS